VEEQSAMTEEITISTDEINTMAGESVRGMQMSMEMVQDRGNLGNEPQGVMTSLQQREPKEAL
jgi:methyl-accepting chemotaxis protein